MKFPLKKGEGCIFRKQRLVEKNHNETKHNILCRIYLPVSSWVYTKLW
jgi:hypothetical protein